MIVCPVCGLTMKGAASRHIAKHGITAARWHALRLEAEHGQPVAAFLRRVYLEERLSSTQIFRRYGITYRILRDLLAGHGIPMRSMSDAIAASWEKDDGSRSQMTSAIFRRISERRDMTGHANPAKRPSVRRKISRAKLASNPGLMPMLEAVSKIRLANPTSIEAAMCAALDRLDIAYAREHRVGRYFIDIALVEQRIAVECDGRGWHARNPDRDARRDAWLTGRGWHVIRYTQVEIAESADACVQDLIARLHRLGLDPATM